MDKATKIADAIWDIREKYNRASCTNRCIEGLSIANCSTHSAPQLRYIWEKKVSTHVERFKQDKLSDPIAYLVLLHAVYDFLEKEGDQL